MTAPHPIVLSHDLHAALSDLARLAGLLGAEQDWSDAARLRFEAIREGLTQLLHRVENQHGQLPDKDSDDCLEPMTEVEVDLQRISVTALDLVLNKRVLVVEDNPDCRLMIAAFLMSRGMRVSLAIDGGQALAAVAESPIFDLVLMDLDLPVIDGQSTTRRLRDQGYSGQICAMSAGLECYTQAELDAAGFDEVMAKPLDFRHLLRMLAIGRDC